MGGFPGGERGEGGGGGGGGLSQVEKQQQQQQANNNFIYFSIPMWVHGITYIIYVINLKSK